MSPQKWPPETRWICLRTSTLPRHHDGPRGRTEVGPRHAMENGRLKGVLGTRTVWQGGMSRGDEREAELSPVGIVFPPGRCRGNTGPLPGCARCHNNNANDRLTSGVGSLTWRSVRGLWRRSNHIKREVQRPKGGEFLGRLGWRVEVFEDYCGVSAIWLCNSYISDRVEIFRTERV